MQASPLQCNPRGRVYADKSGIVGSDINFELTIIELLHFGSNDGALDELVTIVL